MKIARMNKMESNSSKMLAFFDLETDDEILIKGFKLINGTNGMFISSPDDKGKDGKYYESVTLPKDLKSTVQKLAIDEYNR